MKDSQMAIPDMLNTITDVVLAYSPKSKSKAAKKRKRLKAKIEKEKRPTPIMAGFPEPQACIHTVNCCVEHISGAMELLGLR